MLCTDAAALPRDSPSSRSALDLVQIDDAYETRRAIMSVITSLMTDEHSRFRNRRICPDNFRSIQAFAAVHILLRMLLLGVRQSNPQLVSA